MRCDVCMDCNSCWATFALPQLERKPEMKIYDYLNVCNRNACVQEIEYTAASHNGVAIRQVHACMHAGRECWRPSSPDFSSTYNEILVCVEYCSLLWNRQRRKWCEFPQSIKWYSMHPVKIKRWTEECDASKRRIIRSDLILKFTLLSRSKWSSVTMKHRGEK